jgi:hypothetical protein
LEGKLEANGFQGSVAYNGSTNDMFIKGVGEFFLTDYEEEVYLGNSPSTLQRYSFSIDPAIISCCIACAFREFKAIIISPEVSRSSLLIARNQRVYEYLCVCVCTKEASVCHDYTYGTSQEGPTVSAKYVPPCCVCIYHWDELGVHLAYESPVDRRLDV